MRRMAVGATMSVVSAVIGSPAVGQEATAPPPGPTLPSGDPMPLPAVGPMAPGTYLDDSTGTALEFTVGDGWELAVHPGRGFRVGPGLVRVDQRNAELFLTSFQGHVFRSTCWNDDNRDAYLFDIGIVRSDSESLIEYLDGHEFLEGDPVGTDLAGRDAMQLDVRVSIPDGCYPSAALWEIPPNWYHSIGDGDEARFIATDIEGSTFVAFVTAPADVYPGFLELAMEVIDSLSFVGTEA